MSGSPGSASDYDIWVCLSDTQPVNLTNCPVKGVSGNVGSDPIEIIAPTVTGSTGSTFTVYLSISRARGAQNNSLKYVAFNTRMQINQYNTASSTTFGHANAAGAESVGAAFYFQTPPFGTSPPLLESFSSAGGTPILFNTAGTRIAPVFRSKPGIVAPDGTNTTFFGGDIADPGDGSALRRIPELLRYLRGRAACGRRCGIAASEKPGVYPGQNLWKSASYGHRHEDPGFRL